jgi:hypothetical protein
MYTKQQNEQCDPGESDVEDSLWNTTDGLVDNITCYSVISSAAVQARIDI